jgi:hypothetical protein
LAEAQPAAPCQAIVERFDEVLGLTVARPAGAAWGDAGDLVAGRSQRESIPKRTRPAGGRRARVRATESR